MCSRTSPASSTSSVGSQRPGGDIEPMQVVGPIRVVLSCRSICSGVSSSKKPAWKLPALLTSTSMRPNRSAAAWTAASASAGLVTVELGGEEVHSSGTDRHSHGVWVSTRRNDTVPGREGCGDVHAHAPTSTRDEPDLRVRHAGRVRLRRDRLRRRGVLPSRDTSLLRRSLCACGERVGAGIGAALVRAVGTAAG